MPTLTPYELKAEGTWITQSTDPHTGAATINATLIMLDDTVLQESPIVRVSQFVVEQSVDNGATWSSMATMGGWTSGAHNAPRNPGDPVQMPGINTGVPNDGRARRFRARSDFPQALLAGVQITVTPA